MAEPSNLSLGSEPAASPSPASPAPSADPVNSGQPAVEAPAPGFVGVDADNPQPVGQPQSDPNDPAAQVGAGKFELSVAPETVLGTIDGKPFTAQEAQSGYMRQADYSRKTAEMATERKQNEPYIAFVQNNVGYIEDIASGDPQRIAAAFREIAEGEGLDAAEIAELLAPGSSRGGGQTQAGGQSRFNLESYEEGSEAWMIAKAANDALTAQEDRLAKLEGKLDGFTSGIQSKIEQSQRQGQAEQIAAAWQGAQMQGIDVDGAMALVGKPMSVEQAMRLHHFEQILRHNIAVARNRGTSANPPNEPNGVPTPAGSARGKSIKQWMQEASLSGS